MQKMVAEATLPVLQDTDEVDFKQVYSTSTAFSHLLYGRDGCLLKFDDMPTSRSIRDSLDLLLPYLEELK